MNPKLTPQAKPVKPSLLDPDFVYTSHSDVQAVWRRHGWKPPRRSGAGEQMRDTTKVSEK